MQHAGRAIVEGGGMNGKLILLLSMLGLAMALATTYFLPSRLEGFFWLAIFLTDAFVIARRAPGKYFLHGFLAGFANWVWVAAAHVILSAAYRASHAGEPAAVSGMPPAVAAALGQLFGVMSRYNLPIPGLSGIAIGTLSWIAARFLAPKRPAAPHPGASAS